MADVVLDTSAVMALVKGEGGAAEVALSLNAAIISAVNLAELVTVLINGGAPNKTAEAIVKQLSLHAVTLDIALAIRTGTLRTSTAHRGLSLGDRACLALAEREGLPALTADRAWADLDIGVEIRLLR